jgi:hypothetical protein
MIKRKIPDELQSFIDKYFKLKIKELEVICPYFINSSMGIMRKPVFAGKADPFEIESTANELLANKVYATKTPELIRQDMIEEGLGIDCSGLVYQIYNKWLQDILHKGELKDYLPKINSFNPRKILSRRLKPESSVSADMFTSEPISEKINVKDICPGDLIRTRGGKHVLFVIEVEYDNDQPKKVTFVNSATYYKRNGIRFGEITFTIDLNLISADWDDNDPNEPVNYAYKGYRELINKNGVFRPQLPLQINN